MLWKADGEALGADNGAGMWLLLEMIDAGVPGTYIFHRGEECGGVGSHALAMNEPEFLKKFDRAIAFDRKDYGHIITHQGGERCCSNEFTEALAKVMNAAFPTSPDEFKGNDTGSFTDTKSYIDLISECTNISVGYANNHGGRETQDLTYLAELREACLKIDWEALPAVRDPADTFVMDYINTTVADLALMDFAELCDLAEADPYTAAELLYELTRTSGFTRSTSKFNYYPGEINDSYY